MSEENSVVSMDMPIDKLRFGITYVGILEEKFKKKNDELEEKNRIIKGYEFIFPKKYPPKRGEEGI